VDRGRSRNENLEESGSERQKLYKAKKDSESQPAMGRPREVGAPLVNKDIADPDPKEDVERGAQESGRQRGR
jgi:hypothetical protein